MLLCALLLAPACRAQAPAASAEALARTIDAHYNALRALEVEFTQSYEGMGMHHAERGTLLLQKGGRLREGKMRWTYAEPAGKLYVFDGRNGYFYTPGQSEAQRVPAKQLDDLRSPLALLLGHAELAKQLAGLAIAPAAEGDETLSGVPRGLEGRVARLRITASPEGVIHALEIEEVDGARNRFAFSGERANPPVPAGAFVFTPPAGTHVVSGMPPM